MKNPDSNISYKIKEAIRQNDFKTALALIEKVVSSEPRNESLLNLKAKIGDGKDEKAGDRVLPSLVLSSLAYAFLANRWPENLPQVDIGGVRKSFWSMLLREFISTIVITFSTGPLKVWLDVKRGKTSLSEMKANYEDQRLFMHKSMGVDGRPGLFPDANPNLRRRNVDP